jgi:hypothetical protein
MTHAFKRITGGKIPLEQAQLLWDRQSTFVAQHREQYRLLQTHVSEFYQDYISADNYAEEHYADPHPKKALRIQAWEDINHDGSRHRRLWTHQISVKIKKKEWAKWKETLGSFAKPRCIGDLGVPASLQGMGLNKMHKMGLAALPFWYRGHMSLFCAKPTPTILVNIFKMLLDPPGKGFFVYFSDDSCYSIRVNGKVHIFNMDIKSCDASHGPGAFAAYHATTPECAQDDLCVLYEQLLLPVKIKSKQDPCTRFTFKANRYMLYSGSTITTSINNVACLNIFMALTEYFEDGGSVDDIQKVSETAGYRVSCESCPDMQDIQFLKHSPVWDSLGELRALLNLGVLLRASGVCKGDLPGRGDIEVRARRFQGALLQGMYPRCSFSLLDNLKLKTLKPTQAMTDMVNNDLQYKVDVNSDEGDSFYVTDDQLLARYHLTGEEASTFLQGFGSTDFQEQWASPGASKILNTDYELSCRYW